MIVAMKKVAIITRSIDAAKTVKDLRSLGLLHEPGGKDIAELQEELALADAALNVFAKNEKEKKRGIPDEKINIDWHILARHLIDLQKRCEQLELYAQKLKATIAEWEKWGNFEPQEIKKLSHKGIYASLYQVPIKKLNLFPEEAVVKTIFIAGGIAHCIAFSQNKFEIPFKEIPLPEQSLSHAKKRLSEDTQLMYSLKDEIIKMSRFHKGFLKIKQDLEKELELHQAIKGMAQHDALTYIAGYVPVDRIEIVRGKALSMQWGIVVRDPGEKDNVPTLIRNPKWVSLISPLFKLLEVIPGYRELDVSTLFLIFFSIFFGIIIGDAGYGLVYFLLTFLIHRKIGKKADSTVFYLFYVLSSCAVGWGILTGTFFGQAWLVKIGIRPLVPAFGDIKFFQSFCFLLGTLHLSLAHSWKAILKLPSLAALSDMGWIFILWAAFFLAKTLILGDAFPLFGKWFIISGIAFVIFFTQPQKNIIKTVFAGLGALALSLVNSFTDVVSYIRLFAVGLAGIAIADTVNMLAQGTGNNIIAAIPIALIGHSVNIILGPVSVLVHGVRLNVLEFSGHVGVTWSGRTYKPLRE